MEELFEFTNYAHQLGLKVALAGSINASHLPAIYKIAPDIIGVRGVVCSDHDRGKTIDRKLLITFLESVHSKHANGSHTLHSTNAIAIK